MEMQLAENVAARYQNVQLSTSSPGELLIALYDGLFKFLHIARYALGPGKKRAQASEAISRAHAIVSELYMALDHRHAPELCQNLEALYGFCLDRILYANLHNDPQAIEDVMRVLTPVREAFGIAVKSLAAQDAQGRAAPGAR
jgi:flagellar protein FliS